MVEPHQKMTNLALAVPEILRLICEFLTISDLSPLLTVSRRFFACAVPLVWNTVFDFNALRGLLTTVDWADAGNLHLGDDKIQPLDNQSLSRFNLYAPHVRRLKGLTGPRNRERVTSWGKLLEVVPARPILPNLQALEVSWSPWNDRSKLISHIDAFICPTLTEIRCPGPGGQILSTLLASRLSARLAQQCPNIHTLDIYTDYNTDNDDHEDTLMPRLGLLSSADLPSSLTEFHNLRNLGAGPEVLSLEALVTLGNLPSLQSLTIVYKYGGPLMLAPDNISLPHDAFPALRHLGIYSLERIKRAFDLWKLSPLVQQLVSVHVDLDSDSISDESIRDLICLICTNSPLVTDMHFDLDPATDRDDIDLLSPTVTDHLQRLPLRRLRIMASRLELEPASNFEQLVLALTNIEYLHMQFYDFTFEDLVFVAKYMPKLRFLAISPPLSRVRWPSEARLARLTNANPSLYLLTSHCQHITMLNSNEMNFDDVKHISLALHSLWPNGVHCASLREAELTAIARVHEEVDLNCEIRRMFAPKTFNVPSFDDLELEWEYINERHIPWLA